MMKKKHPGQSGFTLIEVLIAVTILAVISFLVFQAMGTSTASKERFEKKDQSFRAAALALGILSRDLASAVLFSNPEFLGVSSSGDIRTKSVFIGTDNGEQDRIVFESLAHVRYLKDVKESDQAEFSFFVEPSEIEGPDGEMISAYALKKREQSPPDDNTDEGGTVMTLLEGIKAFNLRYYDLKKAEYVEQWDSTSIDFQNRMPRAVEITLVIQDPVDEDVEIPFKTTVMLEMGPGPNDF